METTGIKDLSQEFLYHVRQLPGGESIDKCIQCGTCSGSCPTSGAMEYSPREIIAALRAGMLNRVLKSNTVWHCASCYSCSVRCPAKIPFTDVMYELKRLGIEHGIVPRRNTNSVMAKAFTEGVYKYGRSAETEMIIKYYLKTNPFKMLALLPMMLKLILRRRVTFLPHKIKDIKNFRKMIMAVENK